MIRRKVLVLTNIVLVFINIAFVLTPEKWEKRSVSDMVEVAEGRFLVIQPRSAGIGLKVSPRNYVSLQAHGREPHWLAYVCGAQRYDISLSINHQLAVIIDTETIKLELINCIRERANADVTVQLTSFKGAQWDMRRTVH